MHHELSNIGMPALALNKLSSGIRALALKDTQDETMWHLCMCF